MPTYTFENKRSGKRYTAEMKIAELDDYLKANPNVIQVFGKMVVLDAVRLGIQKPDSGFAKHILGRIKDKVPGNNLDNKNTKFHIPREW